MKKVTAAAAVVIAAAGISAAVPSSASTTVPKGCVKTSVGAGPGPRRPGPR